MDHDEALYKDAAAGLDELIRGLVERNFAAHGDAETGKPPLTAVSRLAAGHALDRAYHDRLPAEVDEARDDGATLAQIAPVLGLKGAPSVHSAFGKRKDQETLEESQEVRRAAARARAAAARQRAKEKYPTPEPPGVSALKAGAILGIDPRTVKSRARKGDDPNIKAVTWVSPSGKIYPRYVVTQEGAAQS